MRHLTSTAKLRADAEATRLLGTNSHAASAMAQTVIARAVIDLVGRIGVPLEDVRDHALDIAVDTEVRALLAEAPAGAGVIQ